MSSKKDGEIESVMIELDFSVLKNPEIKNEKGLEAFLEILENIQFEKS